LSDVGGKPEFEDPELFNLYQNTRIRTWIVKPLTEEPVETS
jgi:hypothetical protein